MPKASIQDITALPLSGLRYGLADKLLRINTNQRFQPVAPMQVDALLEMLENAEISISQLINVQEKCKELLAAIDEKKHVADRVYELIISLRLIQADNRANAELCWYLDLLIREWNANIFPAEELKFFLGELRAVSRDRTLDTEIANAQRAMLEGEAPLDINLATPEKQLVWAAHLLFLLFNPYMMYAWPLARRKGAPNLPATGLWKQVTSCHHVRYLRVLFGTHVFNLTRDGKIQLQWGPPGSWFYFNVNPAPGLINCDLLFAMLVGFDHARACVIHEIGHAVQTRGIPDYIIDISERMHTATDPDTAEALKQELELQQYFLNSAEDNCVNRFTQEVGQVFGQDYGYSLNYWYTTIGDVGRRYTRQEPVHLEDTPEQRFQNLTFIVSRMFLVHNGLFPGTKEGWERIMAIPEWIEGRDRRDPSRKLPPEASFQQLQEMCEEVEHYFPPLQDLAGGPEHYGQLAEAYANKRFELIHEIWKLYAEDLKDQIVEKKNENLNEAKDRFNMEMNPSQPPPRKKDKQEEEKQENEGDDQQEKPENPNPPTQSDKNADNESDEELPGDPPDEQPDDSPGGGGEEGDDTSSGADSAGDDSSDDSSDQGDSEQDESGGKSEPQQQQSPSDQQEQPDNDPGEQEEQEGGEDENQEPETQQVEQEREMEGEPPEDGKVKEEPQENPEDAEAEQQEGEEKPSDQKDGEQEDPQAMDPAELESLMKKLMDQFKDLVTMKEDEDAAPQAIEDDENPEAELIREVEEQEPEKPQEEEREDQPGTEQGDAQGGDEFAKGVLESEFLPDEPMASIEELMKSLQQSAEEEAARKEAEAKEPRKPLFEPEEEKPKVKLEIPPEMSLDQLASGDWEDFTKRVAMHGPVIAMMAKALERLKRAQLKVIFKISKKHSIIPQGGDLRRFDEAAMHRLFQQLAKAEKFEKDDLALFKKDGRIAAPTRPTRVILIDGSRSMSMGSRPLPMDKAIQEAVIDYMASRVAGYDTFIAMFGPRNPIMLAEPGDHLVEIGKRIEQVHGGLNTMTYLAPALMRVIERIAYRKKFEEPYTGFTNFVIYSDGDIDDLKQAREIIQQVIHHAPKSTFDFVLITSKYATPMDVLIRTLEFRNPIHEIGVVRSLSQRSYPLALTSTMKLTQRLSNARTGFADPAFVRGAQFKRLLAQLTRGGE